MLCPHPTSGVVKGNCGGAILGKTTYIRERQGNRFERDYNDARSLSFAKPQAIVVFHNLQTRSRLSLIGRRTYRRLKTAISTPRTPIASGEDPGAEDAEFGGERSGSDYAQVTLPGRERPGGSNSLGTADMMRLFNDAQQNMLYLNKQRLVAMEELQKTERDKELLLARVGMLEAEKQAAYTEREILEEKVKSMEAALLLAESRVTSRSSGEKRRTKMDPPAIWSRMLVRVDSMVLGGVLSAGQASSLRSLAWARDTQAAEVMEDLEDKDDRQLASGLLKLLDSNRKRGVHVVHICTEMAPVAQAGSLGMYITELCRALRRKGHLVEVILPKYQTMDESMVEAFAEVKGLTESFFGGQTYKNKIWTGTVCGIPVTFVDPQHQSRFFARDKLYDYEDDFERFTYFSRAALDHLLRLGKTPDIIHLHNWQTAVCAPLFWDIFANQGMSSTRIVFTCHDFKYQHKTDPQKLTLCGLDPYQLNRPDRLQDNYETSLVNLVKGGIVYSNKVTTVSATYASDVKTAEQGQGLDSTLIAHQAKFTGIPCGVDEVAWNALKDPALPAPFSHEDLTGKAQCKDELRQRLDLLREGDRPLVVCLAPSVSERELELVKAAMDCALARDAQFVFLGSSRAPKVQGALEELERDNENKNGGVLIQYDDATAHLLLAAGDILVCPSIFTPSNDLVLAGLKYGAIPVARQLPNVSDSIVDVGDDRRGGGQGNGFTFANPKPSDLTATLARALDKKVNDPAGWEALVRRAMSMDLSWDGRPSDMYVEVYWAARR